MKTPEQVTAEFFAYLDRQFGPGLGDLIKPPPGVKLGERVLYQLLENQEARRPDIAQDNREIEASFAQLAAELAADIDGLDYHTEPATSSGLPYPRAIDIPYAADLALGSLAVDFAASTAELPEPGFALRWLLGAIFAPSAKYLIYLDFTHPKLRALYVAEYDVEYSLSPPPDIHEQLRAFTARQAEMENVTGANQDILWAKLVQIDAEIRTVTKTKNSLVQEHVQAGGPD